MGDGNDESLKIYVTTLQVEFDISQGHKGVGYRIGFLQQLDRCSFMYATAIKKGDALGIFVSRPRQFCETWYQHCQPPSI